MSGLPKQCNSCGGFCGSRCGYTFVVAKSNDQIQLEEQGCQFNGQELLSNHELDINKPCYCGRPMKEAHVQKWVREQLDKRYGTSCVYIKYPAGQYSTRGVSDLIFCVKGIYVAIEVKTDTGKLSTLQARFIDRITKAGGLAYVIYGKDADKMSFIYNEIDEMVNNNLGRVDKV